MAHQPMQVENGCKHHPDCFTCPFHDCILQDAAVTKMQRLLDAGMDPPYLPDYRRRFGEAEGLRRYKRDHRRYCAAARLEAELHAAGLWTKESAASVWASYAGGRESNPPPV